MNGSFFVFYLDDSKESLKDLTELLQKIVRIIGFEISIREILGVKLLKHLLSQQQHQSLLFLRVNIFLIVAQNPVIHIIF